ncbi:hypothetical protein quinque_014026 [Culex quinquefasciatus]
MPLRFISTNVCQMARCKVYLAELAGGGVSFGENLVTSRVEEFVAAATITTTVSTWRVRVPGHRSGYRNVSAGSGGEAPLTNGGDGQDGGVIGGNRIAFMRLFLARSTETGPLSGWTREFRTVKERFSCCEQELSQLIT